MKLYPQIIEKEGKNEFVALTYREDQALAELMHDYVDLRNQRKKKVFHLEK